jgi:hypothetical protein
MNHANFEKSGYPKENFFDFLAGNMDNQTYIGNPHA